MSLVLAFDCAVSGLGIAVVRDGAHLAGRAEGGRDQAARLLPAIETVLGEAGVGRRELSLIAVTIGPGSFTGVRVGLAAARGLAVGLGVPLAGLATTSVLLAQATPSGRAVVAAIDSRLGDWFCAIAEGQDRGQDRGKGEPPPFVAAVPELALRLGGRACLVIGSGAQALVPQLVAAGIDAVAEEALPDPVIIARLAADAGAEAWRVRNEREGLPRPLYLRGVSITLPDGARRTVD
ncbi:MAG TPA: tRNA (adenosine(37)-N6)-threonylcarbamoyltransferase complex dimerization subunit type 1 TsaB [Reyranella sp.]